MAYNAPPPGGYQQQQPAGGNPPDNSLVMVILSFFCCGVVAIPAIVYCIRVNSAWTAGDVNGAHEASRQAKKWSKMLLIIGIAFWLLLVITLVVLTALGVSLGADASYTP